MSIPQDSDLQSSELSSSFRNAMRRLAATVSIVTCADEDEWHGMTATAVTSVCIDPPAILVCVNRAAHFYRCLSSSKSFCVNLLGSAHVQIAQRFGGKLRGVERFDRGNWSLACRLPFLVDASANCSARPNRSRISEPTASSSAGLRKRDIRRARLPSFITTGAM
jgi:flavin reductase